MSAIKSLFAALLLACLAASRPLAQPASSEAEIRATLKQWRDDFNAGRADKVCDIFAPALLADNGGGGTRDFEAQCKRLRDVLADPARSFSYALDLKDIVAVGDMAAVRLVWTLTTPHQGHRRGQHRRGAGARCVRPGQRRSVAHHPLHDL